MTEITGFVPTPDLLMWKYKDNYLALVYGKVQRYCLMDSGKCYASKDTIAAELNSNRTTIGEKLDLLVSEGYLIDLTPSLKNKPHHYIPSGKLEDEQKELKEYAEEHQDEIDEWGQKLGYYDHFNNFCSEIKKEYLKLLFIFTVSHVYTTVSQTDTGVSQVDTHCKPDLHKETINKQERERKEETNLGLEKVELKNEEMYICPEGLNLELVKEDSNLSTKVNTTSVRSASKSEAELRATPLDNTSSSLEFEFRQTSVT